MSVEGVKVQGSVFADRSVTVFATHRFVGIHCWPEAPPKRSYLADPHRHEFHATVEVFVSSSGDREVEFHDLKSDIVTACNALTASEAFRTQNYANAPRDSCERMARKIGHYLEVTNEYSLARVTVSEDGENGATVRWT